MIQHGISKQWLGLCFVIAGLISLYGISACGAEMVNVGLNYPATGPYRVEGLAQKRAAELAVDEVNETGGVLGQQIHLIEQDSQSSLEITTRNVTTMIEQSRVKMVFGGASSAVAIAAGKVSQAKSVPFFATLAYANEVTDTQGHRYSFRECYSAWMGAKALATYMATNIPPANNRYFYITADYVWGHSTEAALRANSGTENISTHVGILTPFPSKYNDLWDAIHKAKQAKPDVLVLVLFGNELSTALKLAELQGLKATTQILAPTITLGMAINAGPTAMDGVVSTTPWLWEATYQYNYPQGKAFVANFFARYGVYPSTSAASAYTILYEYKSAVERAGSFAGPAVVRALEGHVYQLLKDKQQWRNFDHQSIQTVYVVRGRFRSQAVPDRKGEGYFEILNSIPGDQVAHTRAEWNNIRSTAGKPTELEPLTISEP